MLVLCFRKHADGRATLQCRRADGTAAWQPQKGQNARFFARHDLTHYAVETVLGYRHGFYGLMADGWDFSDFGAPWPRGPLPPDAIAAEVIVGFLYTEHTGGVEWSAADFAEQAAAFYADRGIAGAPPLITESQLQAIRTLRGDLFARWEATGPGSALELQFDVTRSF